MADIENPNPDGSAGGDPVLAKAEPKRNSFWAWRERFFADPNPNDDDVAMAEPVERARRTLLYFWALVDLVIFVVSMLLLTLPDRSHPTTERGRAMHLAARVVGIIGMVVGMCLGSVIIYLGETLRLRIPPGLRIIDLLI
jgi:hypothetical protein